MSLNQCELPNVQFENFVTARACLHSTLQPAGALVKRLAIQADKNGKSVWRVILQSTDQFPAPIAANFSVVRARLNQSVPRRGVLRTINLECDKVPRKSGLGKCVMELIRRRRSNAPSLHLLKLSRKRLPVYKHNHKYVRQYRREIR